MKKHTLKIGMSETLTGNLSLQGKECFKGVKLWFKEAKKKGGIEIGGLAEKVVPKLLYFDDKSKPENTLRITNDLINKHKVDLILGPYSSSLTLACIEAASNYDRVVWNHGGSSDEIHQTGYRKIVSSITEAGRYFGGIIDLITYLKNHNKRVAIIRKKKSKFCEHVTSGALNYAKSNGLDTKILEFEGETKDFTLPILEIKNWKADFIFCVGSASDDINFCKALLIDSELKYIFTATLAASINKFKLELGDNCEYFVATSQWEPSLNFDIDFGPDSKTFTEAFVKEYGYMPDYTAAQSYNMCLIIEKLLSKNGVDENAMLKEIMVSQFKTFYGNFALEPTTGKQIGHEMIVVQWQKGEKKIIYPFQYSNSDFVIYGL